MIKLSITFNFFENFHKGLCYIETANLDGETNLKARSSIHVTDEFCSREAKQKSKSNENLENMDNNNNKKKLNIAGVCASSLLSATIECDQPNKQLYEFNGKLKMDREM